MPRARIVVREAPALAHQATWGGAFAAGLRKHGWEVELVTRYRPADMVVFWGVRLAAEIAQQKARGEVVVLERGYLPDRFQMASVSFGGGLNGRGEFRGPHADPSRWQRLFAPLLQPWRDNAEGEVLIMGQVTGDASIQGVDIEAFYARAAAAYRALDFTVRYRPHPRGRTLPRAPRPLALDLESARFVVTWNSNSAVDAVLAGVPAIALDRGSMAWEVAGHELGRLPPAPDRAAWAHRLAWCQWSKAEMASGQCWDAVGRELVAA